MINEQGRMRMKIYDITQELFHCSVYPGDDAPEARILMDMGKGDPYSLSAFSMCCHNGTHIDAPAHFIRGGRTVDQLGLAPFVGACWVCRHKGDVTPEDARRMLAQAGKLNAGERILIAGEAVVTEGAARCFAEAGVLLLGNESQSVGPEDDPAAVHRILLSAGTVLLEGVRLTEVPPGRYLLNAAPLDLGGLEGAPCRAWLMDMEDPPTGAAPRTIEQ